MVGSNTPKELILFLFSCQCSKVDNRNFIGQRCLICLYSLSQIVIPFTASLSPPVEYVIQIYYKAFLNLQQCIIVFFLSAQWDIVLFMTICSFHINGCFSTYNAAVWIILFVIESEIFLSDNVTFTIKDWLSWHTKNCHCIYRYIFIHYFVMPMYRSLLWCQQSHIERPCLYTVHGQYMYIVLLDWFESWVCLKVSLQWMHCVAIYFQLVSCDLGKKISTPETKNRQ